MGPLLLIFLGSVFLLQNMGVLPPTFWLGLWHLWPLLLVLAGVELMFAHRVPWFGLAIFGTVLLVGGAYAVHSRQPLSNAATMAAVTRSAATDLNGANQAQVTVHFGAGQLDVSPLTDPAPTQLALMTFDGPAESVPSPHYRVSRGGIAQLDYDLEGTRGMPFGNGDVGAPHMQIRLNTHVPLTSLTVQTGATNTRLDLGDLQLKSLEMSIGAATAWVRLPSTDGTSTAHVSGGASTVSLEVPENVAASIKHHGGLSTLAVNTARFPQVGEGAYRSPDYDTAQRRLDITLETGMTTIQVN
ncbi:MAG: hypothetical protein NVSMB2_09530 [Chloroflexota bacterium]